MRVVLLGLALVLASIGRGNESEALRFFQAVEGDRGGTSLGVVSLGNDALRETRGNFEDLRLVNVREDEMEAIPFVLKPRKAIATVSSRRAIRSSVESVERLVQGQLIVVIKLEGNGLARELKIQSGLRDFEKSVRVEGSRDGKSWAEIVGEEVILDYSRFIDFRRDTVFLPENDYRWFRVTIRSATETLKSKTSTLRREVSESTGVTIERTVDETSRDFRIADLHFYTAADKKQQERTWLREYSLSGIEMVENAEEQRTEIEFAGNRMPLRELVFETEESNFHRQVRVQVADPNREDGWRTIATEEIFRYELGEFQEEKLRVSLSGELGGRRLQACRVLIDHQDNPTISFRTIRGFGPVYEVYFIRPSTGELRLMYGATTGVLAIPKYDEKAIRAGLHRDVVATRYQLGAMVPNPDYRPAAASTTFQWSQQRWILWVVIALVLAGMTWAIAQSVRQLDKAD